MSFFALSFDHRSFYQASWFGLGDAPEENAKSGYWRLNLYKLQEESERKRKEKLQEEVANAVDKVLETPEKRVSKPKVKVVKPKVERGVKEAEKPPFKPLPDYKFAKPSDNLPLLQEIWAIISFSTVEIGLSRISIQQLVSAVEEAANDEEDIELLLLVA